MAEISSEDVREIRKRITVINHELGGVEREMAAVKTDISWIKKSMDNLAEDTKEKLKDSFWWVKFVLAGIFIPLIFLFIKSFGVI